MSSNKNNKPAAAAAAAAASQTKPMEGLDDDVEEDGPVYLLAGKTLEFKTSASVPAPVAAATTKANAPAAAAAAPTADAKDEAKAAEDAKTDKAIEIDEKMAKTISAASMSIYEQYFAKNLKYRVAEDREYTPTDIHGKKTTKKYPTFCCPSRKHLIRLGGNLFKTTLEEDKKENELFLENMDLLSLSNLIHFVESFKDDLMPGVPAQPLRSKKWREFILLENKSAKQLIEDKKKAAAAAAAASSAKPDTAEDNQGAAASTAFTGAPASASASSNNINSADKDEKTEMGKVVVAESNRGKGPDTKLIAFFKSIATFTDVKTGKKNLFHSCLYNFALALNYVENQNLLYTTLALVACRIKGKPLEQIRDGLTNPWPYDELYFGAQDPDFAISADSKAAAAAATTTADSKGAATGAAAASSSTKNVNAMSD